jgi:hypothetical protein
MIQPRIRVLLRSALTTGAAAALGLGLSSGPASAEATTTGSAWAGYGADSSTYTSVTASWVQPTAGCGSADSDVAFWVGLDGISDANVEQIGTEMDCVGGKAFYEGWYELYPAAPVYVNQALSPGDFVTATVSATVTGSFTLTLTDATAGWKSSSTHSVPSAPRSSAEVVLEVPTASGGTAPAAGNVTFSAAKVNGAALGAADPTLFESAGATCGPLVGGISFSCSWK